MRSLPLAVALCLGLTAAGCQGGDLAQREETTEATICNELVGVRSALEQVGALTPTSTVAEAQAAEQALGQALEALQSSENQLEKLRVEAFQEQLRTFKDEVAKVTADKDLTLEQAADELKGKAGPVIAARQALSTAVECDDATP